MPASKPRVVRAQSLIYQTELTIARQQAIVEELAGLGHDITFAMNTLRRFEELHADFVAARDRLLAQSGPR